MLAAIAYLLGAVIIGALLMGVQLIFTPLKKRDEKRPLTAFLVYFLIVAALPYAWTEGLTRLYGQSMKTAIDSGITDSDIAGEVVFYKVQWLWKDKARAIVVAEDEDRGWKEHVVLILDLSRKGNKWEAGSMKVVNSLNRNEDGNTFPPYY